ncbi:hypothetical protein ABT392_20525 [Paucibacter sp. JuS9]|uniref:hypothetical protein n=1 Tax=Paucibacter sp. JuS9 TaxID=3228748 RepID=UPI0037581D83
MKPKPTHVLNRTPQPFAMRVADLLADDPDLVRFLGPSFKVVVSFNADIRRVTYSFRRQDDTDPDEVDIAQV